MVSHNDETRMSKLQKYMLSDLKAKRQLNFGLGNRHFFFISIYSFLSSVKLDIII